MWRRISNSVSWGWVALSSRRANRSASDGSRIADVPLAGPLAHQDGGNRSHGPLEMVLVHDLRVDVFAQRDHGTLAAQAFQIRARIAFGGFGNRPQVHVLRQGHLGHVDLENG